MLFPMYINSGRVRPPRTGVPVQGANQGSNESISTLTCKGSSSPLTVKCSNASLTTWCIPILWISDIENAFILYFSTNILFDVDIQRLINRGTKTKTIIIEKN